MSDDVDLYDDLPLVNIGESINKIEEERQSFKEQLIEREKDLEEIRKQIAILEKEKKILEENISSLYKTAVSEIKRKDQIIVELRQEKESLIFRRSGRANHTVTSVSKVDGLTLQNKIQKNPSSCEKSTAESSIHSAKPLSVPRLSEEKEVLTSNTAVPVVQSNVSSIKERSMTYNDTINLNTSENISSVVNDEQTEKSFHQSNDCCKLLEYTQKKNDTKTTKSKRSLSSEKWREGKGKESDYYFPKYNSSQKRVCSPPSRQRSRSYRAKSHRDHESRCHIDDQKYYRDKLKKSSDREQKYNDHRSNRVSENCFSPPRRSPCQNWSRKHPCSPIKSDRRNADSKVHCSGKRMSENVRAAKQLKSKYSKAMRDRSVSHTPVKQERILQKSVRADIGTDFLKSLSSCPSSSSVSIPEKKIGTQLFDDVKIKNGNIVKSVPKHEESCKLLTQCQKNNSDNCMKNIGSISPGTYIAEETVKKYTPSVKLSNREHFGVTIKGLSNSFDEKSSKPHNDKCSLRLSNDNVNFDPKKIDNQVKCDSAMNKRKYVSDESFISSKNTNVGEVKGEKSDTVSYDKYPSQKPDDLRNLKQSEINQKLSVSMTESRIQNSNVVNISCGTSPSQLTTTPPSKNLIPLKISPSYEDPAIVKGDKFSFSVFNEQCEFQRSKKKRFKKLVAADVNNAVIENVRITNCSVPVKGQKFNSEQQSRDSSEPVKQNSLEITEHTANQINTHKNDLLCDIASSINSNSSLLQTPDKSSSNTVKQEQIKIKENSVVESGVHCKSAGIQTPAAGKSPQKTPHKRRKLDSICEELKANLVKKGISDNVVLLSIDNTNCFPVTDETNVSNVKDVIASKGTPETEKKCDFINSSSVTAIKSNMTPKCVIIPKRKRRVPNLQDSVVQVLSQVKSTTP